MVSSLLKGPGSLALNWKIIMNNHHPLESIVEIILEHYAQNNEYGLKAGDDFFSRYWPEMSSAQVQQVLEARSSCEEAIKHQLRHFTGGLSCFSPF